MSGIVRKLISPAWGETLLITESQSLSWQTPDGADIPTGVKNNRFSRISQMMLHPGLVINLRKSGIEISHCKQPVNILSDIFACLISFIKAKCDRHTISVLNCWQSMWWLFHSDINNIMDEYLREFFLNKLCFIWAMTLSKFVFLRWEQFSWWTIFWFCSD